MYNIIIMSIDYNNIKSLVNLLYEFVYNKNNKINDNYSYIKLDPTKITINDLIKKDLDYQNILNTNFENKENFKIINFIENNDKKIILKKYFKDFPLTIVIHNL